MAGVSTGKKEAGETTNSTGGGAARQGVTVVDETAEEEWESVRKKKLLGCANETK